MTSSITMVDVEVSELAGPGLHWLVAQIEGLTVNLAPPHYGTGWRVFLESTGYSYRPSTDWSQGGPLLDRYLVGFGAVCNTEPAGSPDRRRIRAHGYKLEPDGFPIFSRLAGGPTILVAACRAIVKVHLGDVVSVPEVLANEGRVHAA